MRPDAGVALFSSLPPGAANLAKNLARESGNGGDEGAMAIAITLCKWRGRDHVPGRNMLDGSLVSTANRAAMSAALRRWQAAADGVSAGPEPRRLQHMIVGLAMQLISRDGRVDRLAAAERRS